MFSTSRIATTGIRAVRSALQKKQAINSTTQRRLMSLLVKPKGKTHLAPLLSAAGTSSFVVDANRFSTNIDRAIDSYLNKDFPGYFDKDHHKRHAPEAEVLDVHKKNRPELTDRSVDEDESLDPVDHDILPPFCRGRPLKLTCHEITKVVEQHHSVDDCLVVDIDVKEMHAGEIPVAFVVPKPDALEYIDPNNEIHDALLNSVKAVLGTYYQNHHELARDVVSKLDELLLSDKAIRQDMIRDEIVQCVRDEYGPCTLVKIVLVDAIPRTASGKAMRGTLYKIARGEPFIYTKLIMDIDALRAIEKEIKKLVGREEEEEASAISAQ